jgi:hypothetical protein
MTRGRQSKKQEQKQQEGSENTQERQTPESQEDLDEEFYSEITGFGGVSRDMDEEEDSK